MEFLIKTLLFTKYVVNNGHPFYDIQTKQINTLPPQKQKKEIVIMDPDVRSKLKQKAFKQL